MQRDINEIEAYLTSDPSRPKLPEAPSVAWKRREPLYLQCCTHEFLILSPGPHPAVSVVLSWCVRERPFCVAVCSFWVALSQRAETQLSERLSFSSFCSRVRESMVCMQGAASIGADR
eukprot:1854491-Rhodomonas_salina.1